MYEVHICPLKRLYEINEQAYLGKCAAIITSSYEIREEKLHGIMMTLTMNFDDITMSNGKNAFHIDDAFRIKEFIENIPKKTDTLFVCCDSGQSRSSAMAAAILRYNGINEMSIWENAKYQPNPFVYKELCRGLGIYVSDAQLNMLTKINKNALTFACEQN